MDSNNMKKIGAVLKQLRNEKNLKQNDLADMLNVKRQTYSAWERGVSSPDIETILFLADFYGVNTDYMFGRTAKRVLPDNELENETFQNIENLSEESKKELEKYIDLLKLKDQMDKGKEEQSSALERKA